MTVLKIREIHHHISAHVISNSKATKGFVTKSRNTSLRPLGVRLRACPSLHLYFSPSVMGFNALPSVSQSVTRQKFKLDNYSYCHDLTLNECSVQVPLLFNRFSIPMYYVQCLLKSIQQAGGLTSTSSCIFFQYRHISYRQTFSVSICLPIADIGKKCRYFRCRYKYWHVLSKISYHVFYICILCYHAKSLNIYVLSYFIVSSSHNPYIYISHQKRKWGMLRYPPPASYVSIVSHDLTPI